MKNFKSFISKIGIIFCMALIFGILSSTSVLAAEIKINNKTLNFNHVYYVSESNGDDATGDGSVSKPFKTIYKAVSICASSGDSIYAKEGTYDVTHVSGSYGTGGLYDYGKSITFVGEPNKTTFLCDGNKNTGRDQHAISTYGTNTQIYDIIFDVKVGTTRTANYMKAVFGRDSANVNAKIYNCVFKYDKAPSMIYDNNGTSNIYIYNSDFQIPDNFVGSYSSATRPHLINSSTNHNFVSEGETLTTSLNNVTYDNYKIISNGWANTGTGSNPDGTQANIGVYGGDFSWKLIDSSVSVTGLTLNKSTDDLQVGQADQLVGTITPDNATNKNVTWTSSDPTVATVDAIGKVTAIKTGTATITATTQDGSNLTATCTVNVTPAIPQGNISLTANTTGQAIALNWNSIDGASGYNVKRSTTQGSGYTAIASNVADIKYTDTNATPGVTYYYVVTPVNSAGEGANSNEALATVVPASTNTIVLNIEPEKTKIKLNETVSANLVIDNIKDIAAEDIRIKYDSTKLQFLSMDEVDGIKLVKSDTQSGELRVIVASKGVANIVNAKKALLKLNFKGIAVGDALVDVTKGRVSDGITMEKDLQDSECGQTTITIEDLKDVNNSGEFTLLDLAIDARHLSEDPVTLTQYNTDIVENNAIDDNDLIKIGEYMLQNSNYTF